VMLSPLPRAVSAFTMVIWHPSGKYRDTTTRTRARAPGVAETPANGGASPLAGELATLRGNWRTIDLLLPSIISIT
jgi:hypothetical protein